MMEPTKNCTKCGEEKPYSEFYKSKQAKNGRQSWCKSCASIASINARKNGADAPYSTIRAESVLKNNGIYCVCGGKNGRGNSHVIPDLWAWGCIPIEAKSAKQMDNGGFSFRFTPNQSRYGIDGFWLFIARYRDGGERFFIVPHSELRVSRHDNGKRKTSLCVVIESEHENAKTWDFLAPYENAFHLIEEERIRISGALKGGSA